MNNKLVRWGGLVVMVGMVFSASVCMAQGAGNVKKEKSMATRASARHILVDSAETCEELKGRIEGGEDFAVVAKEYSKCPSGQQGGSLGEFGRGQMVPEFDKVVFTEEVGKVHGPVKTDFGYHLIEITDRK